MSLFSLKLLAHLYHPHDRLVSTAVVTPMSERPLRLQQQLLR